jgi:hypothetical protein
MEGNKLRMEKSIKLKLDIEWQEKMGIKKERVFLSFTRRIMSSYGYLARDHTNS